MLNKRIVPLSMQQDETGTSENDATEIPRTTLPMQRHAANERGEPIPYLLPIDEWESHRQSFEHFLFHHVLAGHYAAPLHNPRLILDAGCGPGRWVLDMAQEFPKASVIGVDIAPPPASSSTSNALFVRANVLDSLPFNRAIFDFVHMRLMSMAIPIDKWQRVLGEMRYLTQPGGWIELLELGLPEFNNDIWNWVDALGRQYGIDIFPGPRLARWMHKAGLVNVQHREIMLTDHADGKTAQLLIQDCLSMAELLRPEILSKSITTAMKYDQALASMRHRMMLTRREEVLPVYVAIAQTPAE